MRRTRALLFMVCSSISYFAYAWPWDKVDISKLQTKLSITHISSPSVMPINIRSVGLSMDVVNPTDSYIKSITATCSLYTQEGNRITKQESYFGGPAIAPKGRGSLESSIGIPNAWETSSAQCEVSSAKADK